jgi:uncharacterized protein (TIGR00369 family)
VQACRPKIDINDFRAIVSARLPVATLLGLAIVDIGHGRATARAIVRDAHLRPGGTVAGPVMMALADFATYAAVLSLIGPEELTVTSNLNIQFLTKPAASDLIAEARVLKQGRRLAFTDVAIRSENDGRRVAQAACTYAIPAIPSPSEGE